MYGFMCVAATAAIWDNTASYLGLPVSTTHTTGAVQGFRVPGSTAVLIWLALLDCRTVALLQLGHLHVTVPCTEMSGCQRLG
jgi:phosphate/sulfate permease